jgi:hypothetical protein
MVKNLAILMEFVVAFGGLGRFERDIVRCKSEVVEAGRLQMDGLERHLK